jgi:glutamine synthetase
MNQRIEVLLDRDHCLGHAYFMPLKGEPTIKKLAFIFKNQILPPECMDANMNAMTLEELEANGVEILPRDLGEAIQEFEADPLMKEALGEEMCAKIADVKKKEWEEYNAQVSQWEIDSYLLRV